MIYDEDIGTIQNGWFGFRLILGNLHIGVFTETCWFSLAFGGIFIITLVTTVFLFTKNLLFSRRDPHEFPRVCSTDEQLCAAVW